MNKIHVIFAMVLIFSIMIMSGCTWDNTDSIQRAQQEAMLTQQNAEVGLPNISNWNEKKMFKRVLEMRDKTDLITYVYTQNMEGKYVYEGQAIGFPIPYSTQYTNPEKSSGNGYALPQADPNGLFMPSSANATWIQMVNEETGNPEIAYFETNLIVSQSKKPARLCVAESLPVGY